MAEHAGRLCNLSLSGDSWTPALPSLIQPEGKRGRRIGAKTDPKYSKLKRRTEISDFFNSIDPQRTSTGLKSCTTQVPDIAVAIRYAAKLPLVATKCNSIN